MFAAFPFAIFVVALGGFVGQLARHSRPSNQIVGAIGGDLPGGSLLAGQGAAGGHSGPNPSELLSVGAAVTIYAAATGMSSLMKAINRAYGIRETRPLVCASFWATVLTVLAASQTRGFVHRCRWRDAGKPIDWPISRSEDVWPWLTLVRWPVSFALLVTAVAALLRFATGFRTPWLWPLSRQRVRRRLARGDLRLRRLRGELRQLQRHLRCPGRGNRPDAVVLHDRVRAHMRRGDGGTAGAAPIAGAAGRDRLSRSDPTDLRPDALSGVLRSEPRSALGGDRSRSTARTRRVLPASVRTIAAG